MQKRSQPGNSPSSKKTSVEHSMSHNPDLEGSDEENGLYELIDPKEEEIYDIALYDHAGVSDTDNHMRPSLPSSRYPYSMDRTDTTGNVPFSKYGLHDQETYTPFQTDYTLDASSSHGGPTVVNSKAEGSSGIYENIPTIDEPLYDDVADYRDAAPEINELIDTERSYVQALHFLTTYIQPKLKEIPEVDVRGLLGNVNGVLLVHETFLRELQQTETDEKNQARRIGSLFQEFSSDMENEYAMYCYGYARALSLLQTYQETHIHKKIQDVLLAMASHENAKQYSNLSFYLVKPVQRITQYPLLLKNILKKVPLDRTSQEVLQGACNTMENVNVSINESKRRKEIASKYLQSDQRTLMKKMTQLSTHTINKKTRRLSQFLRQEAGMSPKKEDKEFDSLAEKFHKLVDTVNQLDENVTAYVKNVEAFLQIPPQTYPLEYLQESMCPFQGFSQELCSKTYPAFKRRVQLLVLQPIRNLSECLKGPKNLIKKRADKLLDYENLDEKSSETGKMTYEEEDIVNNYKGIHSMLVSELPQCITLSWQCLHNVLLTFITLQKDLTEQGQHLAQTQASQMQCSMVPEAQFRRWVDSSIQQLVPQLNEFIKKFEEETSSIPITQQELNPATERQIQQLLQRYGPTKLYQVVTGFSSTKEMELSLGRGDVVAAIQLADTRGNRNRWLVDSGGSRGYVPSSKLQPYQVEQRQVSPESDKIMERKRNSVSPQKCPYPTAVVEPPVTTGAFQVIAGYSFTARSNYEVTIMAGEPVTVVEPHDKEGRPEWSLVEVRGQRGYVPSSYLITVPVQAASHRP
ncbi:LOW QUALITY PROTEIN: rho guanine nucleotide exchange factor 37 [Hyperolius riggenbachi]|uniref:LOW QUALITY PROTEIN: rho guanine nucleotide exchange factor 37 n=1 Tax=Hyperolius riggenbachi TaxID=752182 RepID=UPI0035A2A6B6